MVSRRVSSRLKESKFHCCLQEEKEGEFRELQAGKHHLDPRKGDGVNPAGSHFQT